MVQRRFALLLRGRADQVVQAALRCVLVREFASYTGNRNPNPSARTWRSNESRARDTIFSDTYRRTEGRRMRAGRSNAENSAEDSKKNEACGNRPHSRPASQAQSEPLRREPPRFS